MERKSLEMPSLLDQMPMIKKQAEDSYNNCKDLTNLDLLLFGLSSARSISECVILHDSFAAEPL